MKFIKYLAATFCILLFISIVGLFSMYVARPMFYGWPLTIEQASNKVLAQMDRNSIEQLKRLKKTDLINLHMNLGLGIRNEFGLWNGNMLLLRSSGMHHPDDASMVIIETAWQKANHR